MFFIKRFNLTLILVMSLIHSVAANASKIELPMPPRANPLGEKQPEFGESGGYFTFDDNPAVIISGSVHYPRVPRAYWRDRIRKAKAMGFNCIGTYIFWNAHEEKPGEFDFSGNLDVAEFVRVCQEEGMWVIVRPGPYICSEWTFGGMPPWVLKDADLEARSNDPRFLAATERYLKAVGEQLVDLQVTKGGPIIQVQVENEYGQFGRPENEDDMAYNRAIYEQLSAAGFDSMFIRCDWPVERTIGTADIDEVYTTMNFGGSAKEAFAFFDERYPGKPKMCGEYWVGWFDHWGSKHHTKALGPFIKEIDWMLSNEVSFNVYMLHGGTNFGFNSGANWSSGQYSADTTSYDYDAPIDEMGRPTAKFDIFKDTIKKYLPADYSIPELPEPTPRMEIPEFELNEMAGFEQLSVEPSSFMTPPHLEALGHTRGLALYTTRLSLTEAGKHTLAFSALKDRAIVIVNGKRMATLDRRLRQSKVDLELPAGRMRLEILHENMGHLNYAREMMRDRKGLGEITFDGEPMLRWKLECFSLELEDVASLKFSSSAPKNEHLPVFYRGKFEVDGDSIGDTMLDVSGWGKGMVWVNGINLGRFWDIGPQYTLYLPGCWIKEGANEVIVMDIEPTGHNTLKGVTEMKFGLKIDSSLNYVREEGETLELSKDDLLLEGEFANGDSAQFVDLGEEVELRYLCVEALSSWGNDDHTSIAELHLVDEAGKWLDRDSWKVIYADSEEISAESASAANVADNQPVTFWHTQYQGKAKGSNGKHPHQIVIDLGQVLKVKQLRYLPRNGPNPGKVKAYRVYGATERFKGLNP